jgi:hypothetical protein
MKHKLIKTEYYLLVVSDEEITEQTGNDTIFNKNLNKITAGVYDDDDNQFKVLAHLPLNGAPYLDGVDVLPKIEDDDFLNTEIQVVGDNKTMSVSDFFKKCGKETYKYTEEDLIKMADFVSDFKDPRVSEDSMLEKYGFSCAKLTPDTGIDRFIQSINQPKLPIAFECEMEVKEIENAAEVLNVPIPKKFTNSEERTEWVGKYLF